MRLMLIVLGIFGWAIAQHRDKDYDPNLIRRRYIRPDDPPSSITPSHRDKLQTAGKNQRRWQALDAPPASPSPEKAASVGSSHRRSKQASKDE